MSLKAYLEEQIEKIIITRWDAIPDGTKVPDTDRLTFGNTGIHLDATVVYADLNGSTKMVDALKDVRAAEYYKSYLHSAGKIIEDLDGTITAYDGDRIMAIFVGDRQVDRAVDSALRINWAVTNIINAKFGALLGTWHRPINHTIGIDSGQLLATKAGVRGESDIVWVGPAANYAAKLTSFNGLDPKYEIRITEQAYKKIVEHVYFNSSGASIWNGPYHDLDRGGHYRTKAHQSFA